MMVLVMEYRSEFHIQKLCKNTSYKNTPIDFSIGEIESVDVINDVTFIVIKGRVAFQVKESKSRILKMIEAAK